MTTVAPWHLKGASTVHTYRVKIIPASKYNMCAGRMLAHISLPPSSSSAVVKLFGSGRWLSRLYLELHNGRECHVHEGAEGSHKQPAFPAKDLEKCMLYSMASPITNSANNDQPLISQRTCAFANSWSAGQRYQAWAAK